MTVWTSSGWAWARASALTAPPLEPKTTAGPASTWVMSRARSSAAHLRGRVPVGVGDGAAVDAPRIDGEHGVVGREQVGQRREGAGVHRGADEHHQRSPSPHLVVQARARDLEGPGGDGRSCGSSESPRTSAIVPGRGTRLRRWGRIIARERGRHADREPDDGGRRGVRPRPGARGRRRRVHPSRGAVAPGAARALLRHARLGPRRRRRAAGRPAAGVARARALRGSQLAALVALHRRHPHLPGHREEPRQAGAAGRSRPVQRARRGRRRPARRRRLAGPLPRRGARRRPGRSGRDVRAARGRRARVRRRLPAPAGQPAGGAAAVRGPRLLRRRDRHR